MTVRSTFCTAWHHSGEARTLVHGAEFSGHGLMHASPDHFGDQTLALAAFDPNRDLTRSTQELAVL